MRLREAHAALISITGVLMLGGCGHSGSGAGSDEPSIAAKPDVIVTFDAKRHNCLIALQTEPHGSAVSCSEVVPFVRDELRLPAGSICEIRAAPDLDETEIATVEDNLKGAGYRFIGGPRNGH